MGIFTFLPQFVLSFVFGQEIYYFNNFFCVCFCLFLFFFLFLAHFKRNEKWSKFSSAKENKKYLYRLLLACAYRLALFPKNVITHRMFLGEIWSGNTIHEPWMIYLKKFLQTFLVVRSRQKFMMILTRHHLVLLVRSMQNSTPSTIDGDSNGFGFSFINISLSLNTQSHHKASNNFILCWLYKSRAIKLFRTWHKKRFHKFSFRLHNGHSTHLADSHNSFFIMYNPNIAQGFAI